MTNVDGRAEVPGPIPGHEGAEAQRRFMAERRPIERGVLLIVDNDAMKVKGIPPLTDRPTAWHRQLLIVPALGARGAVAVDTSDVIWPKKDWRETGGPQPAVQVVELDNGVRMAIDPNGTLDAAQNNLMVTGDIDRNAVETVTTIKGVMKDGVFEGPANDTEQWEATLVAGRWSKIPLMPGRNNSIQITAGNQRLTIGRAATEGGGTIPTLWREDRGHLAASKRLVQGEVVVVGSGQSENSSRFEVVDDTVSRNHFIVVYAEGYIYVQDLASTNGTTVKMEPVRANAGGQRVEVVPARAVQAAPVVAPPTIHVPAPRAAVSQASPPLIVPEFQPRVVAQGRQEPDQPQVVQKTNLTSILASLRGAFADRLAPRVVASEPEGRKWRDLHRPNREQAEKIPPTGVVAGVDSQQGTDDEHPFNQDGFRIWGRQGRSFGRVVVLDTAGGRMIPIINSLGLEAAKGVLRAEHTRILSSLAGIRNPSRELSAIPANESIKTTGIVVDMQGNYLDVAWAGDCSLSLWSPTAFDHRRGGAWTSRDHLEVFGSTKNLSDKDKTRLISGSAHFQLQTLPHNGAQSKKVREPSYPTLGLDDPRDKIVYNSPNLISNIIGQKDAVQSIKIARRQCKKDNIRFALVGSDGVRLASNMIEPNDPQYRTHAQAHLRLVQLDRETQGITDPMQMQAALSQAARDIIGIVRQISGETDDATLAIVDLRSWVAGRAGRAA